MSKQISTTWPEAATKTVVEKTLEEKAAALAIKPKSSDNMVTKEAAFAEPKKKKFVFIVLIIVLVVILIVGSVFAYRKIRSKKEIPLPAPEVVISLTQTPEEPTPTPELKRSDLSVRVLNGSGEAGVASKAQKFLEDLGYEGIEAGNADSYGYRETEISIKESKKAYLEMLIADLKAEYALATEAGALDEETKFDAIITIGEE